MVVALEAELARSGLAGLAKQKGYRRYIKVYDEGKAEVNWEKVKRDSRYDEKFALRRNTELSAREIGTAYKGTMASGACLPRTQNRAGDKASTPLGSCHGAGAFWYLCSGAGYGVCPGEDA